MRKSWKETPKKEARQHYVKFPISLHHLHLITTLSVPFALCHSAMNVHIVFELKNSLVNSHTFIVTSLFPLDEGSHFDMCGCHLLDMSQYCRNTFASHDAEAVRAWVYISVSGEAAFDLEHVFPPVSQNKRIGLYESSEKIAAITYVHCCHHFPGCIRPKQC